MGILDTGSTQTVCGNVWLEIYRQSLPEKISSELVLEKSDRTFKFGDGQTVQSIGKCRIPITLQGIKGNVLLETDFIEKELPLLFSRSAMKKASTVITFKDNGKEVVTMLGKEQQLYVSEGGHLCIPLAEHNLDAFGVDEEKRISFVGKLEQLNDPKRKKVAKLHEQFAHPVSSRLIQLLKNGGIVDKDFHYLIEDATRNCGVCTKYKKPHLTPVVCFPRATEFNEHIALDLKYFSGDFMLHVIDHFTRFSRRVIIKNKEYYC